MYFGSERGWMQVSDSNMNQLALILAQENYTQFLRIQLWSMIGNEIKTSHGDSHPFSIPKDNSLLQELL